MRKTFLAVFSRNHACKSLSPSCTAPLWLLKGNTLLHHCWCPAKWGSSQKLWDRRSASWERKTAAAVQQPLEFQLIQTVISCSEVSVQPHMYLFTFKVGIAIKSYKSGKKNKTTMVIKDLRHHLLKQIGQYKYKIIPVVAPEKEGNLYF